MSENYTTMKKEIEKGSLTEVTAKIIIGNLQIKQLLATGEQLELMEEANKLKANTDQGELNNRFTTLEDKVSAIETEIEAIKKAIEEGSTSIETPEAGATGTSEDPIDAYRGMIYYKDKYYRDSEDGQVYKCFRDSDLEPGIGVQLSYLPHELVNIYFHFERVS